MRQVQVAAERPYLVQVGGGALRALPEVVAGRDRVALLHPPVLAQQATDLARSLADAGAAPTLIEVPAGEPGKTAPVLAQCWDALADAGFTRSDLVVGFGGGATTDLAGFVAATWLRGVDLVQLPTTVLGMVDAAVGGKTGINIAAGKNLVGAFHEPLAVLCDLEALRTLPAPEVASGLAEVVKCGFIADPIILDLIEASPEEALDPTSDRFAELVTRAIAVKAERVSGDLREATSTAGQRVGREALNYGHTLGHAIEKESQFSWRHGEAISVGMVFAAELSRRALGLDADAVARHRQLLGVLGLPTTHHGDFAALRQAMSLDKKARGRRLRFVGLPAIGEPAIIDGPEESLLEQCWRALSD